MKIEIKQLSLNCGNEEYEMLQNIKNDENSFFNSVYEKSYKEYLLWLQKEDDYSKENNLPDGWIPQTTYFLYIDGKPVGIGRIRHRISKYLESIGVGNLGYAISKLYRGRGYGNIMLKELLQNCISFDNEKYVISIPIK